MPTDPIPLPQSARVHSVDRLGVLLVAGSALAWSFGGTIDRFIDTPDTWTVVFWRSVWAAAFLTGFLIVRDGRNAVNAFRTMGWPGLVVALCFTVASVSFVLAIALTTVANVILINASVPLAAALIARIFLGEAISGVTWAAIAAVIAGVAIMVLDGSAGSGDMSGRMAGNLLALAITFVFAIATVVTRRHSNVRMTPAVITATTLAAIIASTQAPGFAVSAHDMGWLFAFGAINLGLGMALFVTGARLVPSALAALLGTLETVLAPVWVWLIHGEKASVNTIIGGVIVVAALIFYLAIGNRPKSA